MSRDLKYIIDKNGEIIDNSEYRFAPNPKNFHNIIFKNGIVGFIKDCQEELEWNNSDRYKKLCNRLYNDGLKVLEDLKKIETSLSKEEVLKGIKHSYEIGVYTEEEYNSYINNIEEFITNKKNHIMMSSQCSLEYKIELYEKIFNGGFDNFIDITKKNGHVVDGVEIIVYNIAFRNNFDPDSSFRIVK